MTIFLIVFGSCPGLVCFSCLCWLLCVRRGQASGSGLVTGTQPPHSWKERLQDGRGAHEKIKAQCYCQSRAQPKPHCSGTTESINSNWWALLFFGHLHLVYFKYLISLALKSCLKTFSRSNPWAYLCFSRGISVVLWSLAGFKEIFCVIIVTNTWIIYFITFWTV